MMDLLIKIPRTLIDTLVTCQIYPHLRSYPVYHLSRCLLCQLQWVHHVDYVCAVISQHLHFFQKAWGPWSGNALLLYCIATWFGNLSVKLRSQVQN